MPELTLYAKPTCPYCIRVNQHLAARGVEIATRNTQDASIKQELITLGGKGQVPCLVIDGKALYESGDIIAWIDANL